MTLKEILVFLHNHALLCDEQYENDKAKIISLINKRPEQLIINDFVFLYNIFSNFSKIK